ncbi:MAG: formylglycine-generating enzyme family protein, partial [Candidatus Competibacteraceae bacterium]|nr:formylglycine-generating enzyme family protein [Candidatus Competibacteraceae bacterium]
EKPQEKPQDKSTSEDKSSASLLPVFRSRLLTQRRLPSAGSNQEPTVKPGDDDPLNLDKSAERALPELEPLTQQPAVPSLPDDPLTSTADQPVRDEPRTALTAFDADINQASYEEDEPRTQALAPSAPAPARHPEPDADEATPPETETAEQVQRPSPLRRRKQQQNIRLGALLTILVVAIGWATFTVYQDYQDKARAHEAQQQQQQAEQGRRLAAQQAKQEQEAARRLEALDYTEQARIELLQGNFVQAKALIKQAEILHPDNRELVTLSAEIREAEARALALKVEVEPRIDMPFVSIPGGCFQMGSPAGLEENYSNETQHQVCLEGFWLSQHELTNEQYRLFKPTHSSGQYKGMTLNENRQPVVEVSWQEATDYANWLSAQTGRSYRLPTEAEWEYAARAGTGTVRYWGDDPANACEYANVADQTAQRVWSAKSIHGCDDQQATAAEVANYSPNSLKLYDMLGNVSEWTCSEFSSNYRGAEKRCSRQQPNVGSRAVRGGSWDDEPRLVRAADRNGRSPDSRDYGLGFRLVRED